MTHHFQAIGLFIHVVYTLKHTYLFLNYKKNNIVYTLTYTIIYNISNLHQNLLYKQLSL